MCVCVYVCLVKLIVLCSFFLDIVYFLLTLFFPLHYFLDFLLDIVFLLFNTNFYIIFWTFLLDTVFSFLTLFFLFFLTMFFPFFFLDKAKIPVAVVKSGSPCVSLEKRSLQVSNCPVVTSFGLSSE